ncbi:MAG TPA: type I-C CRISPR-associated protein Cas5c [Armatimonadota bacterium]|jgi:CRISPR-associated protein Cas5d|nr:type I-C CRISPR-associated protein Cas5 [Armatimonadota bacterium]HOJ22736.1 type I-C CRISPR-associated protein Cas5c [Armatimonadota bacterium]HOM81468.1 type I-C CRISPR-associated protein Cas5c [Armatimonadota bacterium]HOQ27859.1 type I-C CRISPR-associated protein Cas5c [Armatimonadota bacterium]HPO72774.1 type I-C CRISPR-associated protein Cas5c [Armatimonadota bacterium]
MTPNRQLLEVWGDLACFTRPELKTERVSYPLITPSAARAIFDAIYHKPKFIWQVRRIEVLPPRHGSAAWDASGAPRFIALRRNEMKDHSWSTDEIIQWALGKAEPKPLFADADKEVLGTDERGRTQRQTMALRDVRYRLHAEIRPWPEFQSELPAMEAQFRRRAAAGQCIYQPYLGCREFPAYFRLCEDKPAEPAAPINLDVGWMLYDVFDLSRPGSSTDAACISFFRAVVRSGVLDVPEYASDEVRKPYGRGNHD